MKDCSVCSRSDLAEIDAPLAPGEGVNARARRYGISPTTLKRHRAHARVGDLDLGPGRGGGDRLDAPAGGSESHNPVEARQAPNSAPQARTPLVLSPPGSSAAEDHGALLDLVAQRAEAAERSASPLGRSRPGKAGQCACCSHPKRRLIDAYLITGATPRNVEREFAPDGPTDMSIAHHAKVCIPSLIERYASTEAKEIVSTVRDRVELLYGRVETLLDDVEANVVTSCESCGASTTVKHSPRDRAASINAAKGVLELLARILGEIGADVDIRRVLESPRFKAESEAIRRGLRGFPEAAEAVARELELLEVKA